MPPPIAMPESLEELPFPMHGLSLVTEFEKQTPGTTPVGTNVRAYETLTQRNRGGSRPGIVEYIPASVLGFPSKIQHLNIIVDPTTDALLIDDPTTGDTVTDPSTNNLSLRNPPPARKVRKGGSAQQPNRNKKSKKPGKITRVQTTFSSGTFPLAVSKGNLIVAFVEGINGSVTSVTDTAGNSYTQIATSASQTGLNGTVYQQTMWWAIANNSGPPLTISSDQDVQVCVEYTKGSVFTGNPFDSSTVNGAAPNTVNTTMNLGTVAVAGTGELVVAFFGGDYVPAGAGKQIDSTFEFTPVSAGQAVTASGSGGNVALGSAWVAAGASFKST